MCFCPREDQKIFQKYKLLRLLPAGLDWGVRSLWRPFIVIFLLSIFTQINRLNEIPSRYLVPDASRELGAIAISISKTGQFANPYMIPTGPTAHLPPIIPYILSIIYRWFGFTSRAGYLGRLFVIVNGSLLYALLPWFSEKLGVSRQAGFIGGIVGVIFLEWRGHGEYLTGLFLGFILLAFQQRWVNHRITLFGSLMLGLVIGVGFHLQPAILTVIVGCIAFELAWFRNRTKLLYLGILVLGIVIACIPWGWRNYSTFNAIFFIRSNFGLELRLGNHEGASAIMDVMVAKDEPRHPKANFAEVRLLREIGEIKYMQQARAEAWDWIRSNRIEFLELTLQRIANFWAGPFNLPGQAARMLTLTIFALIGVWRIFPRLNIPQRGSLLIPLFTYPLVYYFVAFLPRYRVPIEWILYLLAGFAIWSWIGDQKSEVSVTIVMNKLDC